MDVLQSKEPRGGRWVGFAVLLVGVLIGSLARPTEWFRHYEPPAIPGAPEAEQEAADALAGLQEHHELVKPMARGTDAKGRHEELRTLAIELDEEGARRLQDVRDRAFNSGLIVQSEGDLVPATMTLGGKQAHGKVRIKGDYLDHLDTEKWSLRVELKDEKLLGMSRFSIQHPKTRGFLWEWLIMQAARREGLLAPRSTFVNVVLNGNDLGIYYLEEHFTKELLESQGRREGPIVRFDESDALGHTEQYFAQMMTIPLTTDRVTQLTAAEISAFGEKRLAQSEALARQLQEALEQMEILQREVHAGIGRPGTSDLAQLQASIDQGSRTIEDAIDTDQTSKMHALLCLFRTNHGLVWKNRRFYHNPVTGRLEPIVYDTNAGHLISARDPLTMYGYLNKTFLTCDAYRKGLYEHIARMSKPSYLAALFDDLGDRLRLYSRLMEEEGIRSEGTDVEAIKNALYDQQLFLRDLCRPRSVVGFDCRLLSSGAYASRYSSNEGDIVVQAWTMTEIPVVLAGFRFSNGRFVPASQALESTTAGAWVPRGEPDSVVLPADGRRVTFRFPADRRLATLRDVEEAKQAALSAAEEDKSFKLKLTAEYRPVTEDEGREELLWIRRFGADWEDEGGRPDPPLLRDALDEHPFLVWDAEGGTLRVRPGVHDVRGDLVVPDGHPLHADPGVTLRFEEGGALITGEPLLFEGTEEEPVVLEPQEGVASWQGICVLQATGPSRWRHVHVRDTTFIQRGGWMMTGGVTFYRSPVELVDCVLRNSHGEDAINVFGTDFLLERCTIDGVASDAFDGDFVKGTVRDCTIRNSVEDAVDVSGSDVDVVGCTFDAIGDKGISAGEDSVVRAKDCVVVKASIGAASKDFSRLTIDGFEVREAENYAFAVYIKKPEYGPSSIVAKNVTVGTCGRGEAIVQETCELEIDGRTFPGQPLDVKELYRQKILGK